MNQGILLRGGTLLQYVGAASGPGFRLVIQARVPRNFGQLLGLAEHDDDTNTLSKSYPSVDTAETVSEPEAQSTSASGKTVNRLLEEEAVSEADYGKSSAGSGQDFSLYSTNSGEGESVVRGVDQSPDDALRHVETTLAMVYPFLFSSELSGHHLDRLIAARARAIHAMSNLQDDAIAEESPPVMVYQLDDRLDDPESAASFNNAWNPMSSVEEEASATDSFNKYVAHVKKEIGELCNWFADWWVGLPLYLWLLMVVSLFTIVFSAVILCLHCVQRCCEDDEEATMIWSCSAVADVRTPLLDLEDEDMKSAVEEADTKSGQYEPPRG
eukprot:TRINITY_DN1642_c0_g1_i2.p1 TRINITY_DN1642_c0_g1~~TRINITY_DN1642_c0_g1_i2.p1  ORF type:complete len:327 (-),score=55.55 TRINITY_DN1642_c0_g1_i2:846-1826(-)